MKNRKFYHISLVTLLAFLISNGLFSQSAVVGEVRNGKGVITNVEEASRVLKKGLSMEATISNLEILWEQETSKFFLVGQVSNDPVSAKGVELQQVDTSLATASGVIIGIECHGRNCSTCRLQIKSWRLVCVCDELNPTEGSRCDQVIKIGF